MFSGESFIWSTVGLAKDVLKLEKQVLEMFQGLKSSLTKGRSYYSEIESRLSVLE